ncbi:helix-hairpin-helix domain-containing protein [Humidisolicoccus flavus]|uniref:helix-hairpin-helix domain-containing protein n=1 Tax=Humidisolicoccus flavus TaxID=3111414 RepID=UPI003250A291
MTPGEQLSNEHSDTFDGVKIGRPATGALIAAGFAEQRDLPSDLNELLALHGVGPVAVERLRASREHSA